MKKQSLSVSVLALAVCGLSQSALAAKYYDLDGLKVSGYGRAVVGATKDRLVSNASERANSGINIIQTAGNPYEKTGNLGNQKSEADLTFKYGVSKNDMNWVSHLKLYTGASDYQEPGRTASDYVYLDNYWVHGKGVFKSNPDAVIWMGKRDYGSYSAKLNGFGHVDTDGIGVGLDNWDLGFGELNVAVLKYGWGHNSNEFCSSWGGAPDWECTSEAGWGGTYYTLATSLHSMEIIDGVYGDVFGTYRTYYGSDKDMKAHEGGGEYGVSAKDKHPDGYQVGFSLKHGEAESFDQLVARYSNKVGVSATQTWLHVPSHQVGGFFTGSKSLGDSFVLQYTWSHETAVFNDDVADAKTNKDQPYDSTSWNQFVTRGTYKWNERFSTKLELAYDQVDFEVQEGKGDSGVNSSYKVTLAQDIHIDSGFFDRPIIRFFVTYGELDTETTAYSNLADWRVEDVSNYISETGKRDATTVGVMFSTWW